MTPADESSVLREEASSRLEQMVDRFEAAYAEGHWPEIDDYLPADGPERRELLVHLLHVDLERRLKAGQAARVEDYLPRYPELARDPTVVLDLAAAEYAQRRRRQPKVTVAEYLRRFPQCAGPLQHRLQATLIGQSDRVPELPEPEAWSPGADPAPGGLPSIPGYEVLRELGHGAMGVVYQARQTKLNRLVALKMVLNADFAPPECRVRFLFEAEAAARVQHPNVVQMYEVGTHGRLLYFAREYVDGGTLAHQLTGQPWPQRKAAEMVQTLARATHAAHLQGIAHRDLKPANILLTAGGSPKIADFGLAKLFCAGGGLTTTGAILGTPGYMSPEQASGERQAVGPATDVYALGVILYELLTGTVPFSGTTPLQVLRQIVSDPPPPPSSRVRRLDRDLATVCLKCLEKEPHRRYASAEALADDLGRYLAGEPVAAWPVGSAERAWRWARRNPGWAAMLATVAGLLLIIAVGSPVMTLRLSQALDVSDKALHQAEEEKRKADEQSWEALLAQARASSRSRERGQRFQGLAAIRKALGLPVPPGHSVAELRDVAIACLVLPDVEIAHEWNGFPTGAEDIALDANFERYAQADRDGNVSIRRVADDAPILAIPCRDGGDRMAWGGLAFSPDGRFLYVRRDPGGRLTLYRVDGAAAEKVLTDATGRETWAVAFSPDSRFLAVGHVEDGSVAVHDLQSARQTREVPRLRTKLRPHQLAFRPAQPPGQTHLAVAGGRVVRVFDVEGCQAVSPDISHGRGVNWIAWHPDGRTLATACDDLHLHLWDVDTGKPLLPPLLPRHHKPGMEVAFDPTGDWLLSNDWSDMLRLWDPRTGRLLLQTPSAAWTFSHDGRLVALDRSGSRVRLLRVVTHSPLRRLTASRVSVVWDRVNVRASPDGRLLLVSWGDTLAFVDWATGAEVGSLPLHLTTALQFEPHGTLLTSGPDGLVRWPLRDGPEAGRLHVGPPEPLNEPSNPYCTLGCSADGQVVAIPSGDRGDVLHRPHRHVPLGPREDVRHCAVSPDGRWVVTGHHSNRQGIGATVWEAESGRPVKDFPVADLCAAGFSPYGRWLLTTGGGFRLWKVETWEEGPPIAPSDDTPGSGFAFAPDSRVLALAGGFSQLRLIEVDSGAEIARLTVPEQTRVGPSCFSPDGTQLVAAGSESQLLYLWDLRALRADLKELGLDWGRPDYPPAAPAAPGPLQVAVDGGTLFNQKAP
jgi:WD40 repeat protein/tRNA A-37 threonylcarbamoyl transferase component Bud32